MGSEPLGVGGRVQGYQAIEASLWPHGVVSDSNAKGNDMTQSNSAFVSLKAMAEDKNMPVQKTTYFQVDPRIIIVEDGFNARPLDPDHVASIKLAYRNGATLPPLSVRVSNGSVIIVDGHHRHAALMELIADGEDILRIDCSQFRGNDAERVALMLTTAQGKPLTPLEMGIQYKKLLGFGWTMTEIAAKVGKTVTHVSDMAELARADSDVQTMVKNKQVAAATAVKTVKKHGSDAGAVLAGQLASAQAQGKSKVTPSSIKAASGKTEPSKAGITGLVMKEYGLHAADAERIIREIFCGSSGG